MDWQLVLNSASEIVLWILIMVVTSVIGTLGRGWLETKKEELESRGLDTFAIESVAGWAVRSAEQIFGKSIGIDKNATNEEKLEWATSVVVTQFPNLDEDVVRAAIEDAVLTYKKYTSDTNGSADAGKPVTAD